MTASSVALRTHAHVPPVEPSQSVLIEVGGGFGALVLSTPSRWAGREIELEPSGDPERRSHVWVLARRLGANIVYAAVFPSLPSGCYDVLSPDGGAKRGVEVRDGGVTTVEID